MKAPQKGQIIAVLILAFMIFIVGSKLGYVDFIWNEWALDTKEAPNRITGLINPEDVFALAKKTEEYQRFIKDHGAPKTIGFVVYVTGNGEAKRVYFDAGSGEQCVRFYMDEKGSIISEKKMMNARKHGLGLYGGCFGKIPLSDLSNLKNVDKLYQNILKETDFRKWVEKNKLDYMVFQYFNPERIIIKTKNTDSEALIGVRSRLYWVEINPINGSISSVSKDELHST